MSAGAPEELAASSTIEWTAPLGAGAGALTLVAAFGPGEVSYRARLVVSGDREAPFAGRPRPHRSGARVALALDLSEPALVSGCIEPLGRAEPRASGLYRRLPGRRLSVGESTVDLGVLPRGRYRVRLLVRDRAGNSRVVVGAFGRLP